jgi:TPR repeat protein
VRAAEQGYASAQARLGLCYAGGKGVEQDNLKAYFWLTLAAKQHDKDAVRQRDLLAPKLSADDVGKAEESASAWKAKLSLKQNPRQVH